MQALGRLHEAVEPMTVSEERAVELKKWIDVSKGAGNLSELLLTLGRVPEAVEAARRAVDHADKSGDDFQMENKRTTLADALHHWGNFKEAEHFFREAEEKQKVRHPLYPYLYSLWGYRYCDLLLGRGQYSEVLKRVKQTIEIAKRNNWLLDIALDHLSLGRATLMRAQEKVETADWQEAVRLLDQAVEELRESGRSDKLPLGLFARAHYHRLCRDFTTAWTDLKEAHEIITLGHMKLYLADYHLEAARVCKEEGKRDEAEEHVGKAEELIEEMQYYRRKEEVEEIKNCLNWDV